MKWIAVLLLVGLVFWVATSWASTPEAKQEPAVREEKQWAPEVAARINAVENGLGPRFSISNAAEVGITAGTGDQPRSSIRECMEHHGVHGVSVAVISGGKIEWAKGYGNARVEERRRVHARTLFQSASIGKPITALAALALVEGGALDLDADIRRFLKSWKLPDSPTTAGCTISLAQILSHGAGITVHGFGGYRRGQPLPTPTQILDGHRPANSPAITSAALPGRQWRYSGGGYLVLQRMIEDTAQRDFRDVIAERVFEPIGMEDSFYMPELTEELEGKAAFAYLGDGSPVAGGYHLYPEFGAGAGLWTTATDLARYAIHVQECFAGKEGSVLSKKMAHLMLSRHMGAFGLGLALGQERKPLTFSHSGGNLGFRNLMLAFAETGQGLVVMTNSDRGEQLCAEIRDSVAEVYGWPDFKHEAKEVLRLAPGDLHRFNGRYDFPGLFRIDVRSEGAGLSLPIFGEDETRATFYPETPTRFFSIDLGHELEFQLGASGEVRGMRYFVEGMDLDATRLE